MPKLVQSTKAPTKNAVSQGDGVWLVADEDLGSMSLSATALTGTLARDAVPRRYDLDPKHPLYGQRALKAVLSGSGDIVVGDKGDLVAVKAVEEGVVATPEVIR